MKEMLEELFQSYQRNPRAWRIAATVLLCVAMVWQAEHFGEALGKALYYLTH